MGLNGNDCKSLLEIVDIVYGASCPDVLLSRLFEKLEITIGISSAVFLPSTAGKMQFKARGGILLNCQTAEANAFTSYYAPLDPFIASGWFQQPLRTARNTDLLPAKQLANSEFGVDFLSTVPCLWILGVSLGTLGNITGLIGLHRLRHERNFSDRDVEFIDTLAPHVSRALMLLERLQIQQRATGIVILNAEGAPVYVSDDAARILGRRSVTTIPLPIVKAQIYESSHGTYDVHVETTAFKHRVITLRPAANDKIDSRLTMLGLSSRQQEVALRAVRGLSNAEIADELHITEQTVKDHLHDVFKKVGIHRRSQLATRILSLR